MTISHTHKLTTILAISYYNNTVWLKKREMHKDWRQLSPVEKTWVGKGSKQKTAQDKPHPELLDEEGKVYIQEDSIYHKFECGRALAEMVRPDVSGPQWGGFADVDFLRIAGLARAIQIKVKYPHQCAAWEPQRHDEQRISAFRNCRRHCCVS